mgnify:CR=1 FL=1
METELSGIINGSESMSVKELYQLRKDILETINTEIKRKKTINQSGGGFTITNLKYLEKF